MSDTEHYKVPPPGVPFGYELVVIHMVCSNCGSDMVHSRMEEITRAGYGSKKLALRGTDRLWDRPIACTDRKFTTPACHECIDWVPKLEVRYPVPGAIVGRSAAMKAATGTAAARPRPQQQPIRMEDITDDFA